MNELAQEFCNLVDDDFFACSHALSSVLIDHGSESQNGESSIATSLIIVGLGYCYASRGYMSGELVSFIYDIFCYFRDDIESIYGLSLIEKRKLLYRFKKLIAKDDFAVIDKIVEAVHNPLVLCYVYDEEHGTRTKDLLRDIFYDYVDLLSACDDSADFPKKKFCNEFKQRLSDEHLPIHDEPDHEGPHYHEINDDDVDPNDDLSQEVSRRDVDEIKAEIDSLVGLSGIKAEVSELINMLRVQQLRRQSGLPTLAVSRHMVFYGNPGTGKTSIARKLAEVYKSLGLLSKGHFIEVERSALVAGYLGQTAIKTKKMLDKAKGGILFIDEAYMLCQGGDQDQYGQEAIDTLLKFMEDHRDDLVVIVAGYEAKMKTFLDSNPGFKSRFNKYFYFQDYSPGELAAIFAEMAASSKYTLSPSFVEVLNTICSSMVEKKSDSFGNGRAVRNLFERCASNHANRIVNIQSPTQADLSEFNELDISDADLAMIMQ